MTKSDKLCECGCGERTRLAPHSNASRGWVAGEPLRFIHGHNSRGENHPNWKGGRITTATRGDYVSVLRPDHPRADSEGYVREHILVAEEAMGKPLPEGAVVHHVNGDPSDNRPENLVICEDHAYHNTLHRRQRALDACGHPDWVRCHFCGGYSPESEMRMRKGRPYGHHAECRRAYRRGES